MALLRCEVVVEPVIGEAERQADLTGHQVVGRRVSGIDPNAPVGNSAPQFGHRRVAKLPIASPRKGHAVGENATLQSTCRGKAFEFPRRVGFATLGDGGNYRWGVELPFGPL